MAIDIEYDLLICLTAREWGSAWIAFLRGLYETSGPVAFQVIIVDQSPATRPAEILQKFPGLVLYDNNGRNNTPAALNNALRVAGGRYLALWSPELQPDPSCLETLVRFLDETPDAGICGPQIVSQSGNSIHSGGPFPSLLRMLFTCRIPAPADPGRSTLSREVGWLSGAAMLIRREVFSDTGLLDEGFTTDLFDLDLCRRATENGWHLWQLRDAKASRGTPEKTPTKRKLHGGDVLRLFLKKFSRPGNHS